MRPEVDAPAPSNTTSMKTEHQFRNRLDTLLEGIQIIDYNWRYVYLNDIMEDQSKTSREELIGHTVMEKFPGIENTQLFLKLQQCMTDRQLQRFENKFDYPDSTTRWFDLCVQPAEEGICILSLDITAYKESEEKVVKVKSLYAFLSQINQSIVHLTNEKDLFKKACNIALEFGKFKMAWIGIFNDNSESITLVEQCGIEKEVLSFLLNAEITANSEMLHVLQTGNYSVCHDVENDLQNELLRQYALEHGILSFIILPLRKEGKIIGTFNLYSEKTHFTGREEILLLEEVVTDISFALNNFEKERRHRETETIVIENEKRFRALIEKSDDMKTLATSQGMLLYGSPSVTKVLGYDLKTMVNTSLFNLVHPNDLADFAEKRKDLLKKPGASFIFETRFRHFDGRWIWCEGSATNMLEESGVQAIVSNFRDISEKKRAEKQAEFDKNNTSALINNTDDLMWSVDTEMNLITSNRAFDYLMKRIYGKILAKGESILRPELLKEDERRRYETLYLKALSGKTFRQNLRLTLPNGNWSEISFSPIAKGKDVVGVACHARDMTQRIKTELALERQNKALTKTNFELDRFVYSVSHDLRSPLTSILGLLSFIEEESNETDTLEHASMIRSGINRLDGFIKNILNYSRNNRTEIEIVAIPLQQTILNVFEALRYNKEADQIDFQVDITEEEPFFSDKQALHTLVENIVSNAIKFHNINSDVSFIRVSGASTAGYLDLILEDNGIGIPKEHQDKIFNMFFRAAAEIDGSGIGLYIVKEIVHKLNGTINVESEPGRGTAFHIRLKNLKS